MIYIKLNSNHQRVGSYIYVLYVCVCVCVEKEKGFAISLISSCTHNLQSSPSHPTPSSHWKNLSTHTHWKIHHRAIAFSLIIYFLPLKLKLSHHNLLFKSKYQHFLSLRLNQTHHHFPMSYHSSSWY